MKGTKENMKQARASVVCKSPAGFEVEIYPPSMERHALSGGLPQRLRDLAMSGTIGVDKAIAESKDGDPEMLGYLDGIVARLFVSPSFEPPVWGFKKAKDGKTDYIDPEMDARIVELVSGDNLDEYLLPIDYRWALLVAFGDETSDGEGNPLWGAKSLIDRFATFRDESGGNADSEGSDRLEPAVPVAPAD